MTAINWTPRFTAVLLFLSLVGTAAAFLAWFSEAAHSRLDLLTAWTLIVPVIGMGVSLLLPGEQPPPAAAAGAGLVLASLVLVLRHPHVSGHRGPKTLTPGSSGDDSER